MRNLTELQSLSSSATCVNIDINQGGVLRTSNYANIQGSPNGTLNFDLDGITIQFEEFILDSDSDTTHESDDY